MKALDLKTKIRVYGDQCLREKASPVTNIDENLKQIGNELITLMQKYDGIGLAATQVGIKSRFFALSLPKPDASKLKRILTPGEEFLFSKMPIIVINPKISVVGTDTAVREEGCLSVPGIFADVERPFKIILTGIIDYTEEVSIECSGLLARAVQHEVDHLDGILFFQRLDKKAYSKLKKKLDALKTNAAKNNFTRVDKDRERF
jgi:peptide deformylase